VQAALRLLEEQEVRLAALRTALIEGETSGQSTPFDFDAFIARKREWRNSCAVTRFTLSPRAQADLDEIWDYTVKHWGVDQAEFYVRLIETAIKTVAAEPRRGWSCDEIRQGYKKYSTGSHLLFFG